MGNINLGRSAPDFSLPVMGGGRLSLSDLRNSIIVLHFWSAECSWSRRADVLLVYRQEVWQARGVRIVGVACNYNESESAIEHEAARRRLNYPLLLDAEQKIADLYGALTTPHFYILDRKRLVQYTGALDDATAKEQRARQLYVDDVVEAMLSERAPNQAATPPYGCPINRLRPLVGSQALQKRED